MPEQIENPSNGMPLGTVTLRKWVAAAVGAALLLLGSVGGFFLATLVRESSPKSEMPPARTDFPLSGVIRFQKPDGHFAPASEVNVYLIDASESLGSKWHEVLRLADGREPQASRAKNSPSRNIELFRRALSALVRERTIRVRCNSAGEFSLRAQAGFYYLVASGRVADVDAVWSTRILEIPNPAPILLDAPVASASER